MKPSAEALEVAFQIVEAVSQWDLAKTKVRRLAADDVSFLVERQLDRERRKARAEAFEEAAGVVQVASYLDSARISLMGLAAKERAQ